MMVQKEECWLERFSKPFPLNGEKKERKWLVKHLRVAIDGHREKGGFLLNI